MNYVYTILHACSKLGWDIPEPQIKIIEYWLYWRGKKWGNLPHQRHTHLHAFTKQKKKETHSPNKKEKKETECGG